MQGICDVFYLCPFQCLSGKKEYLQCKKTMCSIGTIDGVLVEPITNEYGDWAADTCRQPVY
jgi:hypothetical protein